MNLVKYALNQLDKRGRKKIIYDRHDEEPYLERYHILWHDHQHRKQQNIPFNAFLHRFVQSDEPIFHNHPWTWYRTVILKGGYWEHTPWGTKWMGPGSTKLVYGGKLVGFPPVINYEPEVNKIHRIEFSSIYDDLHWVEVPKPGKTWTLFIRGPKVRDWGFTPDPSKGTWIQQEEYHNANRKTK
jgi:hypothetical protein